MQETPYVFCADISAGVEPRPIPAVVDDPRGLLASGRAPPQLLPEGYRYHNQPAAMPTTPAARRFLDAVHPAQGDAAAGGSPASGAMWAGCKHTQVLDVDGQVVCAASSTLAVHETLIMPFTWACVTEMSWVHTLSSTW